MIGLKPNDIDKIFDKTYRSMRDRRIYSTKDLLLLKDFCDLLMDEIKIRYSINKKQNVHKKKKLSESERLMKGLKMNNPLRNI